MIPLILSDDNGLKSQVLIQTNQRKKKDEK